MKKKKVYNLHPTKFNLQCTAYSIQPTINLSIFILLRIHLTRGLQGGKRKGFGKVFGVKFKSSFVKNDMVLSITWVSCQEPLPCVIRVAQENGVLCPLRPEIIKSPF